MSFWEFRARYAGATAAARALTGGPAADPGTTMTPERHDELVERFKDV